MVAEVISSTNITNETPLFQPAKGNLAVQYASVTIASGNLLEAGDTIRFVKLPANSVVVGGYLYGSDIDTGTEALDIDIGWEANGDEVADPDGFGNLGVLTGDVITDLKPVAGIFYPLQGVLLTAGPKAFNVETFITATVNTAANAGGTGTLTLVVHYTSQNPS